MSSVHGQQFTKFKRLQNCTIWHAGTMTRKSQNHNSRKAVQLKRFCGMCGIVQDNKIVNRLAWFTQEKTLYLPHCDSSSPGGLLQICTTMCRRIQLKGRLQRRKILRLREWLEFNEIFAINLHLNQTERCSRQEVRSSFYHLQSSNYFHSIVDKR